jgi:hypothetical protein
MNILKTPQQKLLEEAGAVPASPGMLKTPQQLLLEESGVTPKFSDGGSTNPQDMLAELIARGYEPQQFNNGGGVMGTEYVPAYNPDATMQAIPNESLYSRAHGALSNMSPMMAKILLGEARMGETGMEAPIMESLANPLLWGIAAADSAKDTYQAAKSGDPIGYGVGLASTLFNVSPFATAAKAAKKPIKKAAKSILKKIND